MVRRPAGTPASTGEESQRALEAMKAKLELRVQRTKGPGQAEHGTTGNDCTSGTRAVQDASRAGQIVEQVCEQGPFTPETDDSATVRPSLLEQQEALGELTGAPPLSCDPRDPAPPVEALTQRPVVPAGYVDEPATLEWLSPISHANGEKTQISSGGQYEVHGRRTPDGFVFVAKHGLDAIGASKESAESARAMCQRHYQKACEG